MAGLGAVGWIIYAVVIIAMFYFLGVRPQQQEKKKLQDLMSSLAVGDTVLTSSGFYGVIIDLTEDTVIVEFYKNRKKENDEEDPGFTFWGTVYRA